MNHSFGTLAALVLVAMACSTSRDRRLPADTEQVLRGASALEIFALDPMPLPEEKRSAASTTDLHGYPILGRAKLTDARARQELVDLVMRGIRESDGRVAACFNPRHGVRAEHDAKVVDLVICYECLSMSIHTRTSGGAPVFASALTAQSVEKPVTAIFTTAGLQIAKR